MRTGNNVATVTQRNLLGWVIIAATGMVTIGLATGDWGYACIYILLAALLAVGVTLVVE